MSRFSPTVKRTDRHQPRRPNRMMVWVKISIVMVLTVLVVWGIFISYRTYVAYQSLRENQRKIEQMVDAGVFTVQQSQLEQVIVDIRQDVIDLRSALRPLIGISPYFSWIPRYGPLLSDAPQLIDMADFGSEAAVYGWYAIAPTMTALQNDDQAVANPLERIVLSLNDKSNELAQAADAMERAIEARNNIDSMEAWPERARQMLSELDGIIPLVEDALILSQALPEMLGANERQTYLIIAQNEDELRPAGGFISGAGIMVIENGNILSIDFENANLVDDWQNKPYGFPPQPFYELMGMDIFLFRDANFWPDFPTSAESAIQLFSYAKEIPLDGVIAFNQEFVRSTLEVTGPLPIIALGISVDASNVIASMRQEWGPAQGQQDWIDERKSFMGPFAQAFVSQITGNLESIELKSLLTSIHDSIEKRQLQIYMRDPEVAALLTQAGWDGQLSVTENQDYLMLVESNFGFNKTNAAIDRKIRYQVELLGTGHGQAKVAIEYFHDGDASGDSCSPGVVYSNDIRYEELIDDCYWNYFRLLVPFDAQLIDASMHPVAAEHLLVEYDWPGLARTINQQQHNYSYFDNFLLLPPGNRQTVYFDYKLPQVVQTAGDNVKQYTLRVDKQSGIKTMPLELFLVLPPGTEYIASEPEPARVDGQEIIFNLELSADQSIYVQYR